MATVIHRFPYGFFSRMDGRMYTRSGQYRWAAAATALLVLIATPLPAQHVHSAHPISPRIEGSLYWTMTPPVGETNVAPEQPSGSTYSHRDISVVAARADQWPRWVRWGLVGAGAGAVAFAALGRMTIDTAPNPVLQDAALGAASGFVLLGGSIALYDMLCAPRSRSRQAGLC